MMISLRELGMLFDDALDGAKVILLEGIVGETAVERRVKGERAEGRRGSEVWM